MRLLILIVALAGCDQHDSERANARREYAKVCYAMESDRQAWDLLSSKDINQSLKDIYTACSEDFDLMVKQCIKSNYDLVEDEFLTEDEVVDSCIKRVN